MLKEQVIFIEWPILPTFSPSRVLLTKEQLVSVDEESNFLQESFDCVEISDFIFIFKQFYRQLEKRVYRPTAKFVEVCGIREKTLLNV